MLHNCLLVSFLIIMFNMNNILIDMTTLELVLFHLQVHRGVSSAASELQLCRWGHFILDLWWVLPGLCLCWRHSIWNCWVSLIMCATIYCKYIKNYIITSNLCIQSRYLSNIGQPFVFLLWHVFARHWNTAIRWNI